MRIDDLAKAPGSWLSANGPQGDVVISARARLARNLKGYPFLTRGSEKEKREIAEKVREALAAAGLEGVSFVDLTNLPALDRMLLVERHLISKELAGGKGRRAVVFSPDEDLSLMINEEDHLRIQVLKPGLALAEAFRQAMDVDAALEKHLDWAFSSEFGYLTACPTNVGTGLRASVMVHLPALVFMKQIDKVFQAVSKISLAVRGLYGEGTQATGDYYQISNQVTLGCREEDLIRDLERVIPRIAEYERRSRELWLREDRVLLEDRVFRALGVLMGARKIPSEETLDLLSAVRMGVGVGVVRGVDMNRLNDLFLSCLPAHLQKRSGGEMSEPDRDAARAKLVREKLAGATG
ncbi:MAG: protein arginine kinase [Planctomycetes bacterium]|jgi:protein arginine kinase|nr:protein arginine kinase [Planctomycetota bacterium]